MPKTTDDTSDKAALRNPEEERRTVDNRIESGASPANHDACREAQPQGSRRGKRAVRRILPRPAIPLAKQTLTRRACTTVLGALAIINLISFVGVVALPELADHNALATGLLAVVASVAALVSHFGRTMAPVYGLTGVMCLCDAARSFTLGDRQFVTMAILVAVAMFATAAVQHAMYDPDES